MTDLPKEDRDLIELVQSLCCPRVHGCEVNDADECPAQRVRQALAAARSEGPARAPVVDEKDALRRAALYLLGGGALRGSFGFRTDDGSEIELTAKNQTLLAALGASQ